MFVDGWTLWDGVTQKKVQVHDLHPNYRILRSVLTTLLSARLRSHELDDYFHRCITLTGTDLYDTGVSTVTVGVLGSYLIEKLVGKADGLSVLLLACIVSGNLCDVVKISVHASSCGKSGGLILLDLFLNIIENSNLLSVNDFLNSLAVFVLTSYLRGNCNCVVVVLLFNCKSDELLSDPADFLGLSLCSCDLAVVEKICNLVSEQSLSLAGCSSKFSITCHLLFLLLNVIEKPHFVVQNP